MRDGFTLVELAIVLVIVGLLAGGVLTGQSLMRAAELKNVVSEHEKYSTAIGMFREKYFAIPGDMTNATSFWGVDPGGCPGNNTTSTTPRSTTCNGNGDGRLNSAVPTANELYRAWQHLANAGLIEGQYTGVINAVGCCVADSTTTPNVPESKISNGHWSIAHVGTQSIASAFYFDGDYGNAFHLSSGSGAIGGIFTPQEAWDLDTKLDDGKPGLGNVRSIKTAVQANATTGCSDVNYSTTVSIAASSNYLLGNSSKVCSLVFNTGF